MAAPLVKKLPRPGSCAPAVLITKEDLDALRAHALSPAKELPRVLPSSAPGARRDALGRAASPTSAPGARRDAPGAQPWPAAQRRTRSASSKRRPAGPPTGPGLPVAQNVGELSELFSAVKPSRIVRQPGRIERKSPDTRVQPGQRGAVGGNVGPASRSSGNAGNAVVPGNGPACQVSLGLKLELCGMGSKLPRADPLPQREQAPLRLVGDSAMPSLLISGLAAVVSHHPAVSSDSPPLAVIGCPDLSDEDWVSSEGESGHENDAVVDSEGEVFQYRKYRYAESNSRARVAPPEPGRKRGARRAGPPQSVVGCGADSDDECSSWVGYDVDVPSLLQPRRPWNASDVCGSNQSRSHCSTPCCEFEEERLDDANLKRVAEVLVRFYGLPADLSRAVRFRHEVSNVVIVDELAWAQRQRESQFEEPPMLWVRGGRVYDLFGDRGTLAEFEHDLLTRQVEDDSTIRMRRREQGLMPFPFVALPLKVRDDEQGPDQAAAADGQAAACGEGGGGRPQRQRGHWVG